MDKPEVAVITRTKNRNILLRRAIESVLGQSFQNWKMVIVNDGGDAKAVEQLVSEYTDKFNGRCKIIHNSESLGMEAASNVGIKSCDSNYVVIHDDDDSWQPEFLTKCVKFLKENQFASVKGVISYSTRYIEKVEKGKIEIQYTEPYNLWLKSVSLFRMAESNVFPPISFLYERATYKEIGYYRESLPVLGDWEFNLRFVEKYDIALIPEELANYHHRLQIKEGELGNSVIKDDYKHNFYDTMLRNELLRKDLVDHKLGMGYLVNLGLSFGHVHNQLAPIAAVINKMRESRMIRRVKGILRI